MKEKMQGFPEKETGFSKEKFRKPPLAYAPMYNWVWNAPVSHEETDRQLAEMERLGIRAICIIPEPKTFRPNSIPTLMEPDYLTPSYFAEYRYAVEKAKEKGMTLWLYDEGGWPSGGADGKVLLAHPALAREALAGRKREYKSGAVYAPTPQTAAAFLENGEQIEVGFVFEADEELTEYYAKRCCYENPGIPDFPDLTKNGTTEAFLEITHEAYRPHLQAFFGNTITAVFSDEPTGPRPVPFRAELEAEFEKRTGYSIRPFLPELAGDKAVTPAGAEARMAWYDLCSELFCKNYLLKEKEWSNQNGMLFTGHMDADQVAPACVQNGGNYHLLRALRCFDVPGIDVIWRQIFHYQKPNDFNYKSAENGFFPRYASSAAAQVGTHQALTESLGVYGAGVTFQEMRYVMNYQAVRGINVFNIFSVPYAREAFLMTGEMPFFTEKHACYKDLAPFNQYLERISYVASLGKNVSDTALYMPVRDLWAGEQTQACAAAFEKIGNGLEEAQIPFDVLDDDVIEGAAPRALEKGKISMGYAEYTAVVIPPCKHLPKKAAEKLERFIAGGGRVFLLSGYAGPEIRGAIKTEDAAQLLTAPLRISGDTAKIRLGVRQVENGRVYLIYNEAAEEKTITVHMQEEACRLIPENGRLVRLVREGDAIVLTLLSGEMACLWTGDDHLEAESEAAFAQEEAHEGAFTFRRSDRFVIGELQYETEVFSEEAKPIQLGDWSETVGIDYSGSGIYKTKFAAPKRTGTMCLDLGEVHYTCEAYVNGKSLGVRVMPPYRYEIDAAALQAENELEIRVTNTGANEYMYTKSFEKWGEWQLSPYWRRQKLFHEDSLSGGLYGPVRILY